jgi:hypothetical protein
MNFNMTKAPGKLASLNYLAVSVITGEVWSETTAITDSQSEKINQ